MAKGNASIFIYEGGPLEIPALIAVSDNALLLGLFNKKGRFEGQYLLNFEPPLSLAWGGKELFEYYRDRSENVLSMDSPRPFPDANGGLSDLK